MKIRSMRGEVVNFAHYIEDNAQMPAIGNARLNAQGDVLDEKGNVIKTRAEIQSEYHRNKKSVKQVSIKALDTEFASPAEAWKTAVDEKKAKVEAAEKAAVPAPTSKRKLSDD